MWYQQNYAWHLMLGRDFCSAESRNIPKCFLLKKLGQAPTEFNFTLPFIIFGKFHCRFQPFGYVFLFLQVFGVEILYFFNSILN